MVATVEQPPIASRLALRTPAAAWTLVAVLALGHAAVDAAGNFTLARISGIAADYAAAWWMTEAYNLLAFAPQVLFGALADRTRLWLHATILGCLMCAAACVLDPAFVNAAIGLTSIGNALFHIGAGALVLQRARGNAAMPGVFVGPGDMGVVLGVWLARNQLPAGLTLAGAVLLIGAAILALQPRTPTGKTLSHSPHKSRPWIVPVLLALFCVPITLRSLMGSAVFLPWNDAPTMMLALAIAATLAKTLGGFIADRLGWIATTVPAAFIAAPLLAFGGSDPRAALAAMVLVQLAMPVTLAAMARTTPRHPAFAFGLAATCLSLAAVPPLLPIPPFSPLALGILQTACALALLAGLHLLRTSARPPLTDP